MSERVRFPIHLSEGDGVLLDGEWLYFGVPQTLNSDQDARDFKARSEPVEQSLLVYPPLFCIFGGAVKRIKRIVWLPRTP